MTSKKVLLLGGILLDRYYEVDRYPRAGQDTLIRRSFDAVGGCCMNVAVTLKNLGDNPIIVDQYGQDEAGKQIFENLNTLGLSTDCLIQSICKNTGYCLNILSADGERTFFTYRGCEADFPQEIIKSIQDQELDFVYIIGYYLLNLKTAHTTIGLLNNLRSRNIPILFDPGPLVGEIDALILKQVCICSDWLTPNRTELAALQKRLTSDCDLLQQFFASGGKGVVVKKGNRGQEVFTPHHSFTQKGYKVKVVDTTGAGDSFDAGFIHGLMNNFSLSQTLSIAGACGAIATTFKGPHGVFDMKDVNMLILEQGNPYAE